MATRVGGIITVKIDGQQLRAKGAFTFDLGTVQRKTVMGADGVHGYSETPMPAFIEGEITDDITFSVLALYAVTNSTVTLDLANGKTIALQNAWYTGDRTVNTEEGNIKVKFEAVAGSEIGGTGSGGPL